ncbi:MAG: rhomboid family intramembrane serine protease [Candidatus Marinimicrobia bacterium]|nr:rhomboid family intramembrane serine protease [Candidatus Neomarinimicrobiota bacterium]MCF7829263.1 rhomboid family intramembrane serine protease [Candidatus Neomarinimicrobiota bacterium]MCF7881084.1 rhomboid family intramembrane serine protease [Candidatus Neomarinimicrobiota bacterium]
MLIPFKDDNPVRRTPYVTYGLVGLNIAVFLIQSLMSAAGGRAAYQYMMTHFALIPGFLFDELGMVGSIVPFFSSIFMHGGLFHLGGNLLYLWIFADNIESELGHTKFLLFYLLCGIGASLTQIAIDWNSTIPIIGASGAISGVLGAYYLRFPNARVAVLFLFFFIQVIWVPAKLVLGVWFAMQIFSGLGSIGASGGGVAWFAHIGGFVAGIVFFNLLYHIRIEFSD